MDRSANALRIARHRERQRDGVSVFTFAGNEVGIKALLEEARLLDMSDWDDPEAVQEALELFMRILVKERL